MAQCADCGAPEWTLHHEDCTGLMLFRHAPFFMLAPPVSPTIIDQLIHSGRAEIGGDGA